MQATRIYSVLFVWLLFSTSASAQVFDSGPSDSALFTTVINLPTDAPLSELGIGGIFEDTAQLNVANGGSVQSDSYTVSLSEVNIDGGSVGDRFRAYNRCELNISSGSMGNNFQASYFCVVNISGGNVGNFFEANEGTRVNISGGTVGRFNALDYCEVNISGGSVGLTRAHSGSVFNISGGTVANRFRANETSAINISGGTIGEEFVASGGSFVNISGGSIGDIFRAQDGSEVNLLGSDFVVDGVLLDDLVAGEAFTILDRNVTLSGNLADGSPFSFDLNREFSSSAPQDTFDPLATLTVTLAPEFPLGDVNRDGSIEFSDISPFIILLAAGDYQIEADINEDELVDFSDIGPFIVLLTL